MLIQEYQKNEFTLSTDKAKLSLDAICGFLAQSYWAAQRNRTAIAKSIEHSLCFGVYVGARQVAFSRVVTDYSTFAYLCDVFVDEEFRGRGLSKWMMECIMRHPDLSALRRFTLATRDAHALYDQFGFKPLSEEESRRFMSILKEGV